MAKKTKNKKLKGWFFGRLEKVHCGADGPLKAFASPLDNDDGLTGGSREYYENLTAT